MKIYISFEGIETPIVIWFRTTQNWLSKLKYEYKLDVCKDVFVDGYNQADVMQDCKNFLKRLKELKLYMVEFEEDSTMKPKIYPSDCIVRGDK